MKKHASPCVAMLMMIGFIGSAQAESRDHNAGFLEQEIRPPLVFQNTAVADAVASLMQRLNVSVRLTSKEIDGTVSGRVSNITVAEWLSHLSQLYNFYWYFDGVQLEMGDARAVSLDMVTIAPENAEAFLSDIAASNMDLGAFPLNLNEQTGTVMVRGPESLQRVIERIAKAHEHAQAPSPAAPPSQTQAWSVRLIYGRPSRY